MTTRFDILDARNAVVRHIAEHNARRNKDGTFQVCRLSYGVGCQERLRLLRAYTASSKSIAGRWNLDYDDDTRQREQARERQKA